MLEYVKNVVVMTRTRRGRCEELSYLISPICKLVRIKLLTHETYEVGQKIKY